MDEATEQRWRELSEEVLSGMKERRQAHPKATFREIEQAVQERLSRLEAQILQDVALVHSQETSSGQMSCSARANPVQ